MNHVLAPLLVMKRVIDARRDEVFAEWSTPERLARWWEVRCDRRRRMELDRFVVHVCELRAPDRIVFAWGGRQADTLTIITITLVEDGARTRWSLEQSLPRACWASALDRLGAVLALDHHGQAS